MMVCVTIAASHTWPVVSLTVSGVGSPGSGCGMGTIGAPVRSSAAMMSGGYRATMRTAVHFISVYTVIQGARVELRTSAKHEAGIGRCHCK
ncbi:hypothetical protein BC828DRAFT_305102 [Blastocladiella britannica]|nr:hypothetical protein BC828DRAFT_305102 [Blastocladiella britannica]